MHHIVTPAWINLPPEDLRSARKLGRAEVGAAKSLGGIVHAASEDQDGYTWCMVPRCVFIWWIEKFGEVWQIKPWSDECVSWWTLTMIKRGRSQWPRGLGVQGSRGSWGLSACGPAGQAKLQHIIGITCLASRSLSGSQTQLNFIPSGSDHPPIILRMGSLCLRIALMDWQMADWTD